MTLTYNTNVPESVAPGQEFQLTNTSLIAHVEQSALNYFVSPSFSINSENTGTTITKGPYEEIDQDLDKPRDISIPGEGTVDVGPFIAGEEGEVVLKADEMAYTNTFLPPDESLPPINMSLSCMPVEGEDPTIAIIDIVEDTEPPEIIMNGEEEMEIEAGGAYEEPGAIAEDDVDGDLTEEIEISGDVDTNVPGTYTVTYTVEDSAGNEAVEERTVEVVDTTPPDITLNGDNPMELELGDTYDEPGATAEDIVDGDLTEAIDISGDVNTDVADDYIVTYTVTDQVGNEAIEERIVSVIEPNEAPVPSISLIGDAEMEVEQDSTFDDPGATAEDEDGTDLTNDIKIESELDTGTVGTYTITYTIANSAGETASVDRQVHVVEPDEDSAPIPEIELIGADPLEIEVGTDFTDIDPGAAATDDEDGDLTDAIEVDTGDLDTSEPGSYTITYTVTNSAGEFASVAREVIVVEKDDPPEDPSAEGGFLSGKGAPDNDLGEVGDHYLDTEAMELFVKEENGWNSLGVLLGDDGKPGDQGPPGEDGSMWFTDEGEPSADLGQEGDLYLDEDSGGVYQKEDGEWKSIANLEGPKGDCDCPEDNRDDNGNDSGSSGSNGSSNGSNGSSNGDNGSGIGNNDRDNGGSNYSDKNGSDASSDRGGALPDTAGSTPVIILIGSLLTIGGVMLLIRRQLVV